MITCLVEVISHVKTNMKYMFVCIRVHQEVVEESFLPTVRTLMNAPATSPLAEVDISNVVELLVELTRPSALIKPSTNTEVRNITDQSVAIEKLLISVCVFIGVRSISSYCSSHKYIFISSAQMMSVICLECFSSHCNSQLFE